MPYHLYLSPPAAIPYTVLGGILANINGANVRPLLLNVNLPGKAKEYLFGLIKHPRVKTGDDVNATPLTYRLQFVSLQFQKLEVPLCP